MGQAIVELGLESINTIWISARLGGVHLEILVLSKESLVFSIVNLEMAVVVLEVNSEGLLDRLSWILIQEEGIISWSEADDRKTWSFLVLLGLLSHNLVLFLLGEG